MAGIKSLAKDTAVYGLSSILGRLLNWLLVPIYTRVFVSGEYGIVVFDYSAVALMLALLTYGMETGFSASSTTSAGATRWRCTRRR